MFRMITARDLTYEYANKRALDGVSFDLEPGSITALVGHNGAGKTTLLRCIAALEEPFSGHLQVGGLDVAQHPRQVHRLVGYLSDTFGLYASLTVQQCLEDAARLHKLSPSQAQQRITQLAEQLELHPWLDKPAGDLSRGWRQKVGIARALLHQPRLLLLDEPASGLDPDARLRLSALFTQLRQDGMTLVVSSHILSELEDYCTHMLVLQQGKVLEYRSAAAPKTRLRLEFLRLAEEFQAILAAQESVASVHCEGKTATLLFSGTPTVQHDLLRALVQANIPVTAFFSQQERLADVYLAATRGASPHVDS
jgi:ABC-2 type transport system ATP-binding protein